MTIRDPSYDMQRQALGAQGLGYYHRTTPTIDEAIQALRDRAKRLRENIESVDAWRAELEKLEATLKAWGDK